MAHNPERQDTFRHHAGQRGLWAGQYLAPQNDLAATFVATCVDYYLKPGGKFGFVLPYAALRGPPLGLLSVPGSGACRNPPAGGALMPT